MVALEVPAKKWDASAVREIEVHAPMTLPSALTSILSVSILAMVPSPPPTKRSLLGRKVRQLIP